MSFDVLADRAMRAPTVIRRDGDPPGVRQSPSGPYELREVLARATDVALSFVDPKTGIPKPVLKPTSIEVRNITRPGHSQGQVIGLLGPSGVGKTQFSRIIAGLQKPTSGTVEILDFETKVNSEDERKLVPVESGLVGMVAQDYPLFPWRTIMKNLLIAQEHSTLSPKDRIAKAQEFMTLFGIDLDKGDKYPAQLSGGQRQRVAIIRQLLCAEHFLVMDEPFTGLDPLVKEKVCETIAKIAGLHEYNTIFVVAHDITALCQISDQLWLFGRDRDEQGNLLQTGATITKQFDLIERGLAWQPGIYETQPFTEFVREVRSEFRVL